VNGSSNVAVGANALYNSLTSQSVAIGDSAMVNDSLGTDNTAVGYQALQTNTNGSDNMAIGYGADVSSGNLSNATAIGYKAKVAQSNSLILGGTGANSVNVGINTTTPTSTLHVNGSVTVGFRQVSTTGPILSTDYVVEGNCSGGSITLTLPDATTCQGRLYFISALNASSTNYITVTTTASQVIGTYGISITLENNYEQEYVVSDGANWLIMSGSKM
jgi:flagellar basal body rod protein FlgG